MIHFIITILTIFILSSPACGGKKVYTADDKELTVGIVQRDIKVGMSQADVAEALGSPNIVTKDSDERETWVYDKFASEASYSSRGGYWTLIVIGGNWGSGGSRSSQKTLTVVIKFDKASRVQKVTYHASKF